MTDFIELFQNIQQIFKLECLTSCPPQDITVKCDFFGLNLSDDDNNKLAIKVVRSGARYKVQFNKVLHIDILQLPEVGYCTAQVRSSNDSFDSKSYDHVDLRFGADTYTLQGMTLDMWSAALLILNPFLKEARLALIEEDAEPKRKKKVHSHHTVGESGRDGSIGSVGRFSKSIMSRMRSH